MMEAAESAESLKNQLSTWREAYAEVIQRSNGFAERAFKAEDRLNALRQAADRYIKAHAKASVLVPDDREYRAAGKALEQLLIEGERLDA